MSRQQKPKGHKDAVRLAIRKAHKQGAKEILTARFIQAMQAKHPGILAASVREYRFHPTRKWRFDFAWPQSGVAVELQGGTWIHGGHSRGAGQTKDFEKLNAAQFHGWKVFQFSTDMLRNEGGQCADLVAQQVYQAEIAKCQPTPLTEGGITLKGSK